MTKQELIKKLAHTLTYQGWGGGQPVYCGEKQTTYIVTGKQIGRAHV